MVDMGTYAFNFLEAGKLHLRNHLWILMQKKYMNRNKSVLLQNDYI